jgi:hypothetical protein
MGVYILTPSRYAETLECGNLCIESTLDKCKQLIAVFVAQDLRKNCICLDVVLRADPVPASEPPPRRYGHGTHWPQSGGAERALESINTHMSSARWPEREPGHSCRPGLQIGTPAAECLGHGQVFDVVASKTLAARVDAFKALAAQDYACSHAWPIDSGAKGKRKSTRRRKSTCRRKVLLSSSLQSIGQSTQMPMATAVTAVNARLPCLWPAISAAP